MIAFYNVEIICKIHIELIRFEYKLKSSKDDVTFSNIVGNHWEILLLYFAQDVNKYDFDISSIIPDIKNRRV